MDIQTTDPSPESLHPKEKRELITKLSQNGGVVITFDEAWIQQLKQIVNDDSKINELVHV